MAKKGREADCDDVTLPSIPDAPGVGKMPHYKRGGAANGIGPLPHYSRGGKTKHVEEDGGSKGRRRLDRGGKSDWTPKKDFHPGGKKGKLHSELGIPESEKIGASRIAEATHSKDPEIRRDAIRARTMSKWHKG
jgi:hypothetical protein